MPIDNSDDKDYSQSESEEKVKKEESADNSEYVPLIKRKRKKKSVKTIDKKRGLTCSFCSEEFNNVADLRLHKRTVHVNVQCEICNKTFENLRKLKVEKILKGSLDSIPPPPPSVKFQIMGRNVCLRCKGKTLLGVLNKLLKTKSL